MGGAFFRAFMPAAKAPIGGRRGGRGVAYHHQSLALGIGADALGGLWLPDQLPDALRSGARLRMCTVHDGEPELARLPVLRKSQINGLLVTPTHAPCIIDRRGRALRRIRRAEGEAFAKTRAPPEQEKGGFSGTVMGGFGGTR